MQKNLLFLFVACALYSPTMCSDQEGVPRHNGHALSLDAPDAAPHDKIADVAEEPGESAEQRQQRILDDILKQHPELTRAHGFLQATMTSPVTAAIVHFPTNALSLKRLIAGSITTGSPVDINESAEIHYAKIMGAIDPAMPRSTLEKAIKLACAARIIQYLDAKEKVTAKDIVDKDIVDIELIKYQNAILKHVLALHLDQLSKNTSEGDKKSSS